MENTQSLAKYIVNGDEYFFYEDKHQLLGSKVSNAAQSLFVEIRTVLPSICDSLKSKIQWLTSNNAPVSLENGKIVFLPVLKKKKRPKDTMTNFLRFYEKGVSLKDSLIVQEELKRLRINQSLNLKVSSPVDLYAGNLHIQFLIREEFLRQSRQNDSFNNKVKESDFPSLVNLFDNKIAKKSILDTLKAINWLNSDCFLQRMTPEGKLQLEKQFGPEASDKIIDVLNCISYQNQDESIILRSTKTKFLDSERLSEMSQGKITYEDASLLLASLHIMHKGKIPVLDSKTCHWNQQAWNVIQKNNQHFILGLDIEKIGQHPDDIRGKMQRFIFEQLSPFYPLFDAKFKDEFLEELAKVSMLEFNFWFWDPEEGQLRKLAHAIRGKESSLYRQVAESFDPRFQDILNQEKYEGEINAEKVFYAYDLTCEKIYHYEKKVSNENERDYDEDAINLEAASKKSEAFKNKDRLDKILKDHQHIIRLFLKYSTTQITLESRSFNVTWELDEVKIDDHIELQKSGVVYRRVLFPGAKRKDLPYFGEDSILTTWDALKAKYSLNDQILSRLCLKVYIKGKSSSQNQEIKNFIVPLVLLLLGKEPAMDSASHLINYFLLMCVRFGLISFKKALKMMPMIPQGAVAAKQFFSHTTDLPLDWLANVQYKDRSQVDPSFYLPHLNTFLGSASDWIQKYDNVVSIFVDFCVGLIINGLVSKEQSLKLNKILNDLYHEEVPFEDLSEALDGEWSLLDGEDLVGEWVINFLYEFHPLHKTFAMKGHHA